MRSVLAVVAASRTMAMQQMTQMVWTHPKARSYYLASTGRNWVSCPFTLAHYWSLTRHPDPAEVRIA